METKYLDSLRKLYRVLMNQAEIVKEWRYLSFPLGNKYYLIGTPEHSNIGDSAIAVAELLFLQKIIPSVSEVKEITDSEVEKYLKVLKESIKTSSHYFWHGGGNMGDLWFREEAIRRRLIATQHCSKPIIFPQTIFYSETPSGKVKMQESIGIYNKPEMTIVAREAKSYEIMKKLYPEARVLLTPDIVLSTNAEDYGVIPSEREGVLMVSRNDFEKSVEDSAWDELRNKLERLGLHVFRTDMHSANLVTKKNRMAIVRSKMEEFCRAQLVITDRLHGMVFAALTGTPCIVFNCNNHKVKGTYDWISYLDYIRFAETIEDAKTWIPDLLAMKNCEFDNEPLQPYFDELKEYIQNMVE